MPTLEELFNSKNQSLSSFSPSMEEDESIVEESSLTPEELTAAAALGVNTKRLSQKAYKELKTKAENIVKGSSIKPEQTTRELVKGMVKGGGTKSAEVSAKQFVKAQPSLGFPTKDVAEAVGDAIPSGVLKETEKTAIQRSPFLSRILSSAGSAAGKNALRGMLSTGAGTALGLLDPTEAAASSEFPYGAGAKKVVTGMDDYEDEATSKTKPIQRASSNVDSVEQIRGDVEKQPLKPSYFSAANDELQQKNAYFKMLQTRSDMVPEEKARLWDAYLAQNPDEAIEKRILEKSDKLDSDKAELKNKITQVEQKLSEAKNPFAQEGLLNQLAQLNSRLKSYDFQGDTDNSRIMAAQQPQMFPEVEEMLSQSSSEQPATLMTNEAAASLKPAARGISAGEPTAADVAKTARQDELTKTLGEQVAKQVAEEEDFLARFKDAQERERMAKIGIQLGKIGERFGSAVGMVKPGDQSAYDGMMEMAGGISKGVKDEFTMASETEKRNPKSAISKTYQDLVKSMGIKIKGDESAEALTKALPFLQQYQSQKENREARIIQQQIQRESIAASKEIARDDRANKEFIRMTEKLTPEIASARSVFGKTANIIRGSEAIERLASKWKSDELTAQDVQEIAKSLDSILAQGSPTITGTEKLVPKSLIGKTNEMISFITNRPRGAELGKFVDRLMGTVAREKELAREQVLNTQKKLLTGYSHLKQRYPERYNETLRDYGIPTDEEIEAMSLSKKSGQKNSKIEAAAKEAGISYEKMEQYLRQTGQIK
jgi:hypothetical protein